MMFSKDFFSARLKEVRNELTQAQAAQKVGLSQQGWARYESGKVLPGAEAIHQICSSFNVSADWLLGLTPTGNPTVQAGTGAAVNIGSGTATVGGDCSKCQLMAAHVRQITGRK